MVRARLRHVLEHGKMRDLGVSERVLRRFGAVSSETARAMALGALRSRAWTWPLRSRVSQAPTAAPPRSLSDGLVRRCSAARGNGVASQHLPTLQRRPESVRRTSVEYALRLILKRVPARAVSARRLFFALWPSATMQSELSVATRDAGADCGGRPTGRESLHLTLAFLGPLPRRQSASSPRRRVRPPHASRAAPQRSRSMRSSTGASHSSWRGGARRRTRQRRWRTHCASYSSVPASVRISSPSALTRRSHARSRAHRRTSA